MPSVTPVEDSDLRYLRSATLSTDGNNGGRPTKNIDPSTLLSQTYLTSAELATTVKRVRKFGVGTVYGDAADEDLILANPKIYCGHFNQPSFWTFFFTHGATLEQQFDARQSDIPLNNGVPTARLYGPGYLTQSASLATATLIADMRRGDYLPVQAGDLLALSRYSWASSANSPDWTISQDGSSLYYEFVSATAVTYIGNIATIKLAQPTNYALKKQTFISACIAINGEITNHTGEVTITRAPGNSGNGSYDSTTYPIVVHPTGGAAQKWTLSFVSNTAFNVRGDELGLITSGNISSDCIPINPENNKPYFTLKNSGWTGTFAAGDIVTFYTFIQCIVAWEYIEVPQGAERKAGMYFNRSFNCG